MSAGARTLVARVLAGSGINLVGSCGTSGSDLGLVFAATAWHWIDPAVKYRKAASLLRPGGHLAFWEAVHVIPDDGDPFFRQIQDVYDEIGEGMPGDWVSPTVETLPSFESEIAATGLFSGTVVRRFQWEIRYTAADYIRLRFSATKL